MPMTPAAIHDKDANDDNNRLVRLHITPFNPALSKIYLPPSLLPLAQNISYHTVETFPEKGFGYVELPSMEAQKLKKKLNGSTLKGSKVRIEEAKPEKRKVSEEAGDGDENRPTKRSKKAKKERGVLEGITLEDDRKVKRGWTEPPTKNRKEKKEKKSKDKDKEKKPRKESKYTKEPELLFKAKLTPAAAVEVSSKEKKKDKKEKKSKSKKEVIVHEFEKNTKQPSFLKQTKVSTEKKPAVEYVNGQGWVDEDGNVVEPETGKARNRRVLELVDTVPAKSTDKKQQSATPSPKSSPAPSSAQKKKQKSIKRAASPVESSESESESEDAESSVVSSSSEDEDSDSEDEPNSKNETNGITPSPAPASKADTPEISLTLSSPVTKEVHPLEAIFKRGKPSLSLGSDATSTPNKGLAPINTSFSFFDGDADNDSMEIDGNNTDKLPVTPHTQRDLEWRGQRSAAPTPDTAAVGRRFSFPWRNGSQEVEEEDEEDSDDDHDNLEAVKSNTKANAASGHLALVAEEKEDEEEEDQAKAKASEELEVPESEFKTWFWEKQGGVNRAWKKNRRGTLKSKRLTDNKKAAGGGRKAV